MSEIIEGEWWELVTGEEAVAILSQRSGYALNKYYVNNLVAYGRLKPWLRIWKYNFYRRSDVEALPPIQQKTRRGLLRKRKGKGLEAIGTQDE